MFLVDTIVQKIVDPILDALLACTVRQFRYVVDCNQNIDDFANQVENLGDAKRTVERRVADASNNAEVVEDKVSKWLTEVQSSLPRLEEARNRLVQGKENVQCFDVLSRYRMGKEGFKKKPDVTKLIGEGNFDTVAHRPPLTATWHKTYTIKYESVPSRDLLFQQIMEAIRDDRIYEIGIHGMPGVGKTRMMEEVAQQSQKEGLFDEIGKTVVSENPNLKDIQQKLAESLNLNLDKETEGARKELIHNRLKNGKTILIMVDDLWNDRIKLEDIGIPAADNHTPGCKVVLTSRRKDVCEYMGVKDSFQIGVLWEDEAWSLFQKKVGYSINHPEMRSIAEKVCGQCAGLPLAILAVAGALKNKKSKEEWQDAHDQLRDSRGDNIGETTEDAYSSIRLSYDYLKPTEAKSIFLLCCMFPEDADIPIDDLVMYAFARRLLRGIDTMNKARNRAHTLINTLKTYSLLLEGKSDEFVKMHDVIRDVAISIASKSEDDMFLVKSSVEKWPEEDEYRHCRTISLIFNNDYVFPDESQCPELRSLRLDSKGKKCSVPSSFFNGMNKLEVLDLCGISISTLPLSLHNLRMLRPSLHQSVNLAFLKELKKLEILSIKSDHLKELAPEISLLTSLRSLDLRKSYYLETIPAGVISSLSQLEELYISQRFDQWEKNGNASLDELNSLRCLTRLEYIFAQNGKSLPLDELKCKSLIMFKISIGIKYFKSGSSATKILKLKGIPVKTEHSILMEKAEELTLIELKGLKDVFQDREQKEFLDLKHLEIDDCDGVEHLFCKPKLISHGPCASGSFYKLSVLQVKKCPVRSLFSTAVARSLPQLQELDIQQCSILEEIISNDQEFTYISFPQLKKLKLCWLPKLRGFFVDTEKISTLRCNTTSLVQALFNDKVRFPALETLEMYGLGSLTAIWDNQSFLGLEAHDSFQQLKSVAVQRCDKLVNVIPPNAAPWFQNLRVLLVESCDSVKSVVEVATLEEGSGEILIFPHLQSLKLQKLQNLEIFCYSSSGGSIEEEGNGKILVFPQLNDLELEGLPRLRSFCCSRRGGEEILVVEEEGNVPQSQQLFNHKVNFPILTHLRCYGNIRLDHLLTGFFGKIRNLKVKNDSSLVNASSLLQQFEVTEEFTVEACSSVEVIFNLDGLDKERQATVFSQIKKLKLLDLPKLERIWMKEPKGLLVFHNLTSLEVVRCKKLRYLFSLSTARCLTQLRELNIYGCREMEEIVTSEGHGEEDDMEEIVFPQLQSLTLSYLRKLTCFSRRTNAFNLPSLNELDLRDCTKLETFTFGHISTPIIKTIYANGSRVRVTDDLNRDVQLIVKGVAMDIDDEQTSLDEDDDEDEETSLNENDDDDEDEETSLGEDDDEEKENNEESRLE